MLSLEDEREITAVILRYATAIDTRDWPLFRTCFTADARSEYGSFGSWSTSDQLARFMEDAHLNVGPTLHRMSNIVITGDGGHARARTYVDALLMPKQAGGAVNRGIGYYDDDLSKSASGWKISKRIFTSVRIV
jgi:SnoaL-like domain